MTTQPIPATEPGEMVKYRSALSAKKAGVQTATSIGALLGAIVLAAVADPRVAEQVGHMAKDAAWVPVLFVVLRYAASWALDRWKHRGPDGELIVKGSPVVQLDAGTALVATSKPAEMPQALAALAPPPPSNAPAIDEAAYEARKRMRQVQLHGARKTCPVPACDCGLPKRSAKQKAAEEKAELPAPIPGLPDPAGLDKDRG